MYKQKYKKGDVVKSLDELVLWDFVYLGDNLTHREWAMSCQISMAYKAIQRGDIRRAVKVEGEAE